MLTPQKVRDPTTGEEKATKDAGLGVGLDSIGGITCFQHTGHNLGYQATMLGFAGTGRGAIVMTNGENGDLLISEILGSIANAYDWPLFKPEPIPTIEDISTKSLQEYEGSYQFKKTKETIQIEMKDGKLYSNSALPFRTRLYPIGPNKFMFMESGETFSFIRNDDGKIVGIESNKTELDIIGPLETH